MNIYLASFISNNFFIKIEPVFDVDYKINDFQSNVCIFNVNLHRVILWNDILVMILKGPFSSKQETVRALFSVNSQPSVSIEKLV